MEFTTSFQSLSACIWMGQTNVLRTSASQIQAVLLIQSFFIHYLLLAKCKSGRKHDACQCWLCCFPKLLKPQGPKTPKSTIFAYAGQSPCSCRLLNFLNLCGRPWPCNSKLLSAIKLPLWNNFSNKATNPFFKKLNIRKPQSMIKLTTGSPVFHTSYHREGLRSRSYYKQKGYSY